MTILCSIHSGSTTGDIKMNFGRAERLRYKKYFVPMYGSFLQKCYCKLLFNRFLHTSTDYSELAPEECWSCALSPEEGFEALATMDFEADGVTLDSCSTDIPSTEVEASRPNEDVNETQDIQRDFEPHHFPHSGSATPRSRPVSPNPSQCPSVPPFPSQPIPPVLSQPVPPILSQPVPPILSQPVSPVVSHSLLPHSLAVSPGPSHPVSPTHSSLVSSQPVPPVPSQPVSRHASPHSRPIQSLSKKRKDDSSMHEALKKVRSDEGTTSEPVPPILSEPVSPVASHSSLPCSLPLPPSPSRHFLPTHLSLVSSESVPVPSQPVSRHASPHSRPRRGKVIL